MENKLSELEKKIGYCFRDKELLRRSMLHSSYANENGLFKYECNERLEFLGDAVLELISSEFLFHGDEKMPEGELTRLRASMVCESSLAYCAGQIGLGDYLLLGRGEEATGGRHRASVTSDAMEALIGAVYLDGGFASAKELIHRFVLNDLERRKLFYDSKTILQEMVQAERSAQRSTQIFYRKLGETGPDHDKVFRYAVYIGGKRYGVGKGHTKKAAEQEAAYRSILLLRGEKQKS